MQGRAIEPNLAELLSHPQDRPTALLCANEEIALAAVRTAEHLGLDIPGDLSVVSFNDTPRSALVRPALTSVSVHTQEMANAALRLLAERVLGSVPAPALGRKKWSSPPPLSLRESTGPSNC